MAHSNREARREIAITSCGLPNIANRLYGIQDVLDNLNLESPWLESELAAVLKHPQGTDEPDIGALIDKDFLEAVISDTTPRFNGTVLSHRGTEWRFRKQKNGPVQILLTALEKTGWRVPIKLAKSDQKHLAPNEVRLNEEQVKDAAKELRKKTKPYLTWHAASDGTIEWQALPAPSSPVRT